MDLSLRAARPHVTPSVAALRRSAGGLTWLVAAVFAAACGGADPMDEPGEDAGIEVDAAVSPDAAGPCVTTTECAPGWEQNASDRFDAVLTDDAALAAFLKAVPKGGDLHNHLSGSVYAETYLDWGRADGFCINNTTYVAVSSGQCSATNLAVPTAGEFFDRIVRAWSMKDFVAGTQTGRDHFFATFGKFGAIAGPRRYQSLADVAKRAADENQLYVETMFNLGSNVGDVAEAAWPNAPSSLTAANLPTLYANIMRHADFTRELANDVNNVNASRTGYRAALGCDGASPPAACDVGVRFIAQISRTGPNDQIFGQMVSAFEMAKVTPQLVGANLSSPEDDDRSLANYRLHMDMLAFLHTQYTVPGLSPLRITLHAGELTPEYLPVGSDHNTFHIRSAVEVAHAERIGHGVDVLSETDSAGLLTMMRERNVLVEVCLSSNIQILEVSGTDHPLAAYIGNGVPVALATDDQGVSRSSLAGEYARAARDQQLDYRQLKKMARDSLEHAFLPGASLWTAVSPATPVAACAATSTMAVGEPANESCAPFLAGSERARLQWELERRFLAFEREQPATP